MPVSDVDINLDALVADEVGRGAQAAVYRLRRDGVDYAVKALHSPAAVDEHTVAAFRREAALLARVNHPAVPRIFDVGQSAGRPYLIMEFIDGRPLSAGLDAGPFADARLVPGHAVGDEVIRRVAETLRANVHDPDLLCRYGGEEFAIVLTRPDHEPVEIAERLRHAIREAGVDGPDGTVGVTVSIGVAELGAGDELDGLLGRADAALYRAKEGGRDQVRTG